MHEEPSDPVPQRRLGHPVQPQPARPVSTCQIARPHPICAVACKTHVSMTRALYANHTAWRSTPESRPRSPPAAIAAATPMPDGNVDAATGDVGDRELASEPAVAPPSVAGADGAGASAAPPPTTIVTATAASLRIHDASAPASPPAPPPATRPFGQCTRAPIAIEGLGSGRTQSAALLGLVREALAERCKLRCQRVGHTGPQAQRRRRLQQAVHGKDASAAPIPVRSLPTRSDAGHVTHAVSGQRSKTASTPGGPRTPAAMTAAAHVLTRARSVCSVQSGAARAPKPLGCNGDIDDDDAMVEAGGADGSSEAAGPDSSASGTTAMEPRTRRVMCASWSAMVAWTARRALSLTPSANTVLTASTRPFGCTWSRLVSTAASASVPPHTLAGACTRYGKAK